jgi:hypothetical protein
MSMRNHHQQSEGCNRYLESFEGDGWKDELRQLELLLDSNTRMTGHDHAQEAEGWELPEVHASGKGWLPSQNSLSHTSSPIGDVLVRSPESFGDFCSPCPSVSPSSSASLPSSGIEATTHTSSAQSMPIHARSTNIQPVSIQPHSHYPLCAFENVSDVDVAAEQITPICTTPITSPALSSCDGLSTDMQLSFKSAATEAPMRQASVSVANSTLIRPPSTGQRECKGGINKKSKGDLTASSASRFCHICSRTAKLSKAVCSNFRQRTCRKSICQMCFADNPNWDWAAATAPNSDWKCTHCRDVCHAIPKARCLIYGVVNERRRLKRMLRKKALGLGTSSAVPSTPSIPSSMMTGADDKVHVQNAKGEDPQEVMPRNDESAYAKIKFMLSEEALSTSPAETETD